MSEKDDFVRLEGFEAMGRINAGLSHLMKNIMATISETAGLMEDWVDLAEAGRELDMNVLKKCCQTMSLHIQRSYGVINHLNRLAHSLDRPRDTVDIHESLELTVGLARFLSYTRDTEITRAEQGPILIETNPFFLVDLLFRALDFAYQCVGLDDKINISVYDYAKNLRILFSGLKKSDHPFPDDRIKGVAQIIKAEVLHYRAEGELHVVLPHALPEEQGQGIPGK